MEKIKINGWELLDAHQTLANISRQRLVTCKASYNLNKIIKMADKVIRDEKLYDKRNECVRKFSKKSEDKDAKEAIVVDPDKMEEFMKEADKFLKVDFTIDYTPVKYLDLEGTGLQLSLEELTLVEKFIIVE